ncbi:MAG TPA: sigma-70 family RNA polymerase sigma factor [Acidobacteriota bacterium]|mgnify:CR=1 FL=1|nr:sigma-70 family RNA polymerase sigma factor [Acidobacteriota bacterium]
MDSETLLKRCKQGDELAWEALVRKYQGRVYSVAFHYVGNTEDARDLAQEIFVKLYHMLPHIESEALLPWMIRVARNASIDFLRRKSARPPGHDIAAEDMRNLPTHEPSPEEWCERDDQRRLVYRALTKLTHLNREIIILKEIQGMSIESIASLLGIPIGTVKSRSNRARIELAEVILTLKGARSGES